MADQEHVPLLYSREQLFKTSPASMYVNRYHLNSDHEAHSHDFFEMTMITGGEGEHVSIHGSQPIRRGDVFIIRPGAWHAYQACSHLEGYNCCFGVDLLQRELFWVREDALLNYLFWIGPLSLHHKGVLALQVSGSLVEACREYLEQMLDVEKRERRASKPELLGYLLVLMSKLALCLRAEDIVRLKSVDYAHPAVMAGIKLLEDDPAYDWSLGELAERLHLNRSHVDRMFSAAIGLPPMEYLARYRAERAAALLLNSTLSISEIGQKVGWDDPNYFARRFRFFLGLSPSQYRRNLHYGV